MKKFGIARRSCSQSQIIYKPIGRIEKTCGKSVKDLLHELYWNQMKSQNEIGRELGVKRQRIQKWMKKFGIPSRTISESHNRNKQQISITKEVEDYLDGLLLGDGALLRKPHLVTPLFQQSFANWAMGWALEIESWFKNLGIKCRVYPKKDTNGITLTTECHPIFRYFSRRWYNQGKKAVPRDIDFSPTVLRNWYLGDGSLGRDTITLCTHGFTKEEVEWLARNVSSTLRIGALARRSGKYFMIQVRTADSKKFLGYVGHGYPSCFSYKFDLKGHHWRKKWLSWEDELVASTFLRTRSFRATARELMHHLDRSFHSIRLRARRIRKGGVGIASH